MKQFLFICMFAALSFSGLQAQSDSQVVTLEKKTERITKENVSNKAVDKVAAKKKDILNEKINLKLNGQEGLFLVADKRIVC
ncbi:hypothetical protein C1T31_07300 [Hanstruepera neustonica]|uniref:Uncharacterized protein n=1 Tax=Hanstruepera neustonica TaxID=1445657 RepID=A0A2K1DZ63_9FLAO|nr:hypothetical protein [Hanstruepera neustonica]PNQ73317.1 hypothetical protein C1T31_07300 [Hanstruepera neustonica]